MALTIPEIISYHHPAARYGYSGDGVQLAPHVMPNGDNAFGLQWVDDNIPEPTMEDIDTWRASAESGVAWEGVREQRDALLNGSDYVVMPDYPLEDKSEWVDYRQDLRDVPQTFSDDPESVVWPEIPEE